MVLDILERIRSALLEVVLIAIVVRIELVISGFSQGQEKTVAGFGCSADAVCAKLVCNMLANNFVSTCNVQVHSLS